MKLKTFIAALSVAAIIPSAVYAGDNARLSDAKNTLLTSEETAPSDRVTTESIIKNFDSTDKAPDVTSEMCTPSFWQSKSSCSDEIIMTQAQIAEFNRKNLKSEETCMYNLTEYEGTYDGEQLAKLQADFESPQGLYLNGEPVPESYYEKIRENIRKSHVSKKMPYKFGFAVNRTIMKSCPYEDFLSDDPSDPEWDELTSTAISVNEPLVIFFTTADGKFTFVNSRCYSGWAPTEDIGVCESKAEWESLLNPKEFLVVTGEKVYLEPSADKDLDEKLLTMGTVLPLSTEYDNTVAYRIPWNNYVVKMPARDKNGRFYQKDALISANRDVNVGYLPYTYANVLSQAFKCLGNRYGWGGMMYSQDCSAFAQEVYRCFGFELARDSSKQGLMPTNVINMSEMTEKDKMDALDSLPAGTILIIPGHEMIYLGKENGLYYVINDSGTFRPSGDPDEAMRSRGIIINTLSSAFVSSGKTWLECLKYAVVIK